MQREAFSQLLAELNQSYNVLSYHNFTHAFALFQLLFCCHELSDLKLFVQPLEMFAALVAGLAHDLNHSMGP